MGFPPAAGENCVCLTLGRQGPKKPAQDALLPACTRPTSAQYRILVQVCSGSHPPLRSSLAVQPSLCTELHARPSLSVRCLRVLEYNVRRNMGSHAVRYADMHASPFVATGCTPQSKHLKQAFPTLQLRAWQALSPVANTVGRCNDGQHQLLAAT